MSRGHSQSGIVNGPQGKLPWFIQLVSNWCFWMCVTSLLGDVKCMGPIALGRATLLTLPQLQYDLSPRLYKVPSL